MTRATRFATYASVATLCYFLAWFSIIPIPFIAEETKDQLIPVVRTPGLHEKTFAYGLDYRFVVSVVDVSIVWILFVGIARVGVVVIQGLSRSVHRVDACASARFLHLQYPFLGGSSHV